MIEGMKNLINEEEINKIIEMDADLSHAPSEIQNNLKIFEKDSLDLLISSRYLKDSKIINWSLESGLERLSELLIEFIKEINRLVTENGKGVDTKKEHLKLVTW